MAKFWRTSSTSNYLASILSNAIIKNSKRLKKEISKSLMFLWWASILNLGFNFKIVYLATKALDIPLCCTLNKNCLLRLDIYIQTPIPKSCPGPERESSPSASWTIPSISHNQCRQHPQSKSSPSPTPPPLRAPIDQYDTSPLLPYSKYWQFICIYGREYP